MTSPTIHNRVTQAVLRDAELQDQKLALREVAMAARLAEDVVRKSTTLKDATDKANAECEASIVAASASRRAAMIKPQREYDEAITRYNAAKGAADGVFSRAELAAKEKQANTIASAKRAFETEAATAKAVVYRADQEVAAHQTTIDQHRRNILDQLGINLGNILG